MNWLRSTSKIDCANAIQWRPQTKRETCEIMRFYFDRRLAYFQVRHCVFGASANVRALISVILPIGMKTIWSVCNASRSWLTERWHGTTEHVACTFNEQSQILNAQKANYELIWTGNTPNFIIYLWVCDGRVLTNCFFLFLCVCVELWVWRWWVAGSLMEFSCLQMGNVYVRIKIKYLNHNQMRIVANNLMNYCTS